MSKDVMRLRSLNGTFPDKSFDDKDFPLQLGRLTEQAPNNQLFMFDSKVVSRNHAEIIKHGQSQFFIRDTKSSSGTFVNGKRLSERGVESDFHKLNNGDQIQMGEDHNSNGVVFKSILMVVFFPHSNDDAFRTTSPNDPDNTATVTYVKDRNTLIGSMKIETQTRFSTSLPSPMEERLKLLPEMNVMVRLYTRNGSFALLQLSVNCTTSNVLSTLQARTPQFTGTYSLYLCRQGVERKLDSTERPIHMTKTILEQTGYNEGLYMSQLANDNAPVFRLVYSDVPLTNQDPEVGSSASQGIFDLSNKNLLTLPSELFSNESAFKIDLSGNPGINIPISFAQKCHILSELSMQRCQMYQVMPDILFFHSLTILDLSYNNLTVLPSKFGVFGYLKELNLRNNQLKNVPDEFSLLTNLSVLNLSNNQLDFLPKPITRLVKLTFLDISFNHVCYLPTDVGKLLNLQRFLAVQNKLAALPYEVANMTSLIELDIRHNKISELDTILSLAKLETLRAEDNQILDIILAPSAVTLLSTPRNHVSSFTIAGVSDGMVALDISGCKLSVLPENIGECLPGLRTLNISNNHLQALPDSIGKLTKLTAFLAAKNKLLSLPNCIGDMTSLNRLDIRCNSLKKLPSSIWNFENLLYLNASSNNLENFPLPEKDPKLGYSLRILLLGDNKLTGMYGTVFRSLGHLQELVTLNLAYNNLKETKDLFSNLPKLEEVHLSGNELRVFPDDIEKLRSLRVLNISRNDLTSLPGRIAKLKSLSVLDCRSNCLRYNVSNWPEEWNWNWNLELKHLDFSNNKEFEILPISNELSDFSTLTKLDILGVLDCQFKVPLPPTIKRKGTHRRITSDLGAMKFGMAEFIGKADRLNCWEVFMPEIKDKKDHVIALFDGHSDSSLAHYLSESFPSTITTELAGNTDAKMALKKTFLQLNQEAILNGNYKGHVACVALYFHNRTIYTANVGDAVAILSRDEKAMLLSTNHALSSVASSESSEIDRVRNCGGALNRNCLIDGEVSVARCFGLFHHMPVINANPAISDHELSQVDEYIIIANSNFWSVVDYQTAVDISIHERGEPSVIAMKLRDIAISYGAQGNLMVMVLSVQELFGDRLQKRSSSNSWKGSPTTPFPMVGPPVGRVVLVFTDIKSSTMLWEKDAQSMHDAIVIHNRIMRDYLKVVNGYEVKTEGDAFMVSFWEVKDAVDWCITVQLLLLNEIAWPDSILDSPVGAETRGVNGELLYRGISVRMGIHVGYPVCNMDPTTNRMDYFGPVVNRSARICGAADGGEIFISADAWAEFSNDFTSLKDKGLEIHACDLGLFNLKGLEAPEHLLVIYPEGLKAREEKRKKQSESEEEKIFIKYIKLPQGENPIEKWPCSRIIHDIGMETKKGKLGLTPTYVCFISKPKGILRTKEKETLAIEINDIKEVKKVEGKFGSGVDIICLNGTKVTFGYFMTPAEDVAKKIESHRRAWVDGKFKKGGSFEREKSKDMLNLSAENRRPSDQSRKASN